ncbi:hypothetical protein DB346_07365 [Verrucomicrobia bacterium LW23]|nr:hypothetical protein DB346_07365 [Verrucomicrobia bacterium LW23]
MFEQHLASLGPRLPTSAQVAASNTLPSYEWMSGALIWDDEEPLRNPQQWKGLTMDELGCLRALLAHRTALIVGNGDARFAELWAQAKAQYPGWIGFAPERCTPNEVLAAVYHRSVDAMMKDLEALMGELPDEEKQGEQRQFPPPSYRQEEAT